MIIVMVCSETKNPGIRRAFNKYAGRQFTILNDHIHGLWMAGHTVFILSALYGLIPAHRLVEDYNIKLNRRRLAGLTQQIRDTMSPYDLSGEDVVVYGGKLYREAIAAATPLRVTALVGEDRGCGDHFAALQDFLNELSEDA